MTKREKVIFISENYRVKQIESLLSKGVKDTELRECLYMALKEKTNLPSQNKGVRM